MQWQLRILPKDPVRDERGYVIEPLGQFDETTWNGRLLKRLAVSGEATAENQRRMGYQVYPGDPGIDPFYMSEYEQHKAMDPMYKAFCSIL